MGDKTPSVAEFRASISYDPNTGEITRISGQRAGRVVGHHQPNGYLTITFRHRTYRFHRVAWALHTGGWPIGQIDHIDGVTTNNKWSNIRDVTAAVNSQNKREAYRNNQSKVQGATPMPTGEFMSRIFRNGRRVFLGVHPTAVAAGAAYQAAKVALDVP